LKEKEWEARIESKIYTLVNHFIRKPLNYFTESDIHSYLYLAFYRDKIFSAQLPSANQYEKTILIHREYPTFFKYDKKIPIVPRENAKSRGHYDLVILNPNFVESYPISIVTNRDYHIFPKKLKQKPLVAAIEFKYIVRKLNNHILRNIELDFQKLQSSVAFSHTRYFLIFNSIGSIGESLIEIERMKMENPDVKALYVEAWYEGDKRNTYKKFWMDKTL